MLTTLTLGLPIAGDKTYTFGFEGRIWDLIVSVPDHCLSFYFTDHLHAGVRCRKIKFCPTGNVSN